MTDMMHRSLGVWMVCGFLFALLALVVPALAQNPPGAAGVPGAAAVSAKAVLSGKVTDKAGKPVANANVQLVGQDYQQARTDAQGNYAFRTIKAAGQYRVGVDAQGFLPIEYWNSNQVLQLTPQAETKRDLVVERGGSIVVTVTDAAGEPVKGARVDASPLIRDNRGGNVRSSQTDDAGMATVTVAPSKKQYLVCASRDGFAPAHSPVTIESVENPVDVAMAMEPGQSVKGVALCNDGKPASGWEIYATPDWWVSNYLPTMSKIDAQGNFTLKDLGPGAYKLNLHVRMGNGGGTIHEIPVTFSVPLAQQPLKVDVPMPSPASRVKMAGKVRVTGGQPDYIQISAVGASGAREYYNAQVDFGRSVAKGGKDSAIEGSYDFGGVPAGTYQLQFQSPTTESKTLEGVKIPGEIPLVELKVVGKPHLSGAVTDAATGAAVPQFSMRVRKLRHLGNGPQYSQQAQWAQVGSADGKFDLELMSAGVYQVQVMADGYAAAWSKEVRIENAEAKTDAQVKLTAGGTLTGTVVDQSGKPIAGAKVSPFSVAGYTSRLQVEHFQSDLAAVKTDAAGRFTLAHLAGGDEKLRIVHPDFAPKTVAGPKVTEAQATDAGTIRLSAGGSAQGVVYDENGKPAAGVSLEFRDQEGWSGDEDEAAGRLAQAVTDDEGRFGVEHLPEMATYIMLQNSWERQGVTRRVIHPIEGKTTHIDFGGTNAVTGRVVGANGPVANAWLQFGGESAYSNMAVKCKSDAAGRFTLHGPPAGRYSLYCATDLNRRDYTWVKDVELSGKATDLGDLKAEGISLLITVTADDPATLEGAQYVSIERFDGGRGYPGAERDATTGQWRAKGLAVGKYRVGTSTKGGASFMTVVDCDGKEKEQAVSLRMPKASSTLALSIARMEGSAVGVTQIALLANDDMSVLTYASSEGEQPRTVKLPPGTYRVRDYSTRKVREDVPAITLTDGETKAVEISLSPQKGIRTVMVGVWSADGVQVSDVRPRVLDGEGKAVEQARQGGTGNVYALAPGHYRAVVDRAGTETVTKEFDVAAGTDQVFNVDLFLQ